jgi:hypothetical protein
MTVTEMQRDVDAATGQGNDVESPEITETRQQREIDVAQKRRRDEGEFLRLSRRNAQLSRSFTAEHQRERASLQVPLMELYATLNPTSIYKWDDDFEVVTRAAHRTR